MHYPEPVTISDIFEDGKAKVAANVNGILTVWNGSIQVHFYEDIGGGQFREFHVVTNDNLPTMEIKALQDYLVELANGIGSGDE